MALPKDIEPRSREEWTKLAGTTDPKERKQLMTVLRALGHDPVDVMGWSVEKRVEAIMKEQGEESKASAGKGKVTETKASSGSSGGGGDNSAVLKGLGALGDKADEAASLNTKIHNLLVVLIATNPEAKSFAESMDVELKLIPGNE